MPTNNNKWFEDTQILSFDEIVRLASIFVNLGIEEIRITGGEPLVRPALESLIYSISIIPQIKSIGLTTNGLLLEDNKIKQLLAAGLTSVNISLDSFKEDKFESMSGMRGAQKVINSIEKASKAGLEVKINTVIVRGWNDDEVIDFAMFARDTGITVRFIEFMPLDGTGIWRSDLVFTKNETIKKIESAVERMLPIEQQTKSETARLYSFSDGIGKVGFIPSITEPFCHNCDRIRITSEGRFLTCLFENPGHDVKTLLRSGASDKILTRFILDCMKEKPEGIIKLIRANDLRPKLNLMHRIGG